jgi:hypothetical protein
MLLKGRFNYLSCSELQDFGYESFLAITSTASKKNIVIVIFLNHDYIYGQVGKQNNICKAVIFEVKLMRLNIGHLESLQCRHSRG